MARIEITGLIIKLDDLRSKIEDFLNNAEDRGDENRAEELREELDRIENALSELEEIE